MIGVSGMRGVVGDSLAPPVVYRMAAAFADWLWSRLEAGQTEGGPPSSIRPARAPRVVFGRDSRPSGPFVRDAAASAIEAAGIELIDLGIVTTPGVAMMVQHLGADAGIIATASHNPIQWNGLKFLDSRGVAPPPADVAEIHRRYDSRAQRLASVERLVAPQVNTQTHALHVKRVLERVDVLGIASKALKVVVDSVNGAGCVTSATMLSKLGCRLMHINSEPSGLFPHDPEPIAANLTQLCEEVKRQRAAVGFAQDPDADRVAIVDENGTYIGEEYSLALATMFVMRKKTGVTVIANLSTSRMIDDIAAKYGGRVLRTPVGEANVVDAMLREGAIIGGEGNGGVIDPRIVPGRDSLVGMAFVLQLMAETGKSIGQLVNEIPRYVIVKEKLACPRELAQRAAALVPEAFEGEKIDLQDGVRVDWADSWVSVRASNTEPILRIIAEARDESAAQSRIAKVRQVVERLLTSG